MNTKRVGIFLIIAGILWFAATVAIPFVDSIMAWNSAASMALRYAGPKLLGVFRFFRLVLLNTAMYGYKQALLLIISGIGFLLM